MTSCYSTINTLIESGDCSPTSTLSGNNSPKASRKSLDPDLFERSEFQPILRPEEVDNGEELSDSSMAHISVYLIKFALPVIASYLLQASIPAASIYFLAHLVFKYFETVFE